MISPVELSHPLLPCGDFGAIRKHDVHTGIDFYCNDGSPVICLSEGEVIDVFQFTGEDVGTPWWNDTWAVVVKSELITFVYGEVSPLVNIGDEVVEGECLGFAKTVLKKDKGVTPTCMLHLETWENDNYIKGYVWELNTEKPIGLINPCIILGELK